MLHGQRPDRRRLSENGCRVFSMLCVAGPHTPRASYRVATAEHCRSVKVDASGHSSPELAKLQPARGDLRGDFGGDSSPGQPVDALKMLLQVMNRIVRWANWTKACCAMCVGIHVPMKVAERYAERKFDRVAA